MERLVLLHAEGLQVCELFAENRSYHGTWMRAVVDAQNKAVFVSGSLFPIGYVDSCQKVKIPVFFCPTMRGLGCTIFVIVFPSEFNGVVLLSRSASFRVPRFPVVVLPAAFAFFFFCASSAINPRWHEAYAI